MTIKQVMTFVCGAALACGCGPHESSPANRASGATKMCLDRDVTFVSYAAPDRDAYEVVVTKRGAPERPAIYDARVNGSGLLVIVEAGAPGGDAMCPEGR